MTVIAIAIRTISSLYFSGWMAIMVVVVVVVVVVVIITIQTDSVIATT